MGCGNRFVESHEMGHRGTSVSCGNTLAISSIRSPEPAHETNVPNCWVLLYCSLVLGVAQIHVLYSTVVGTMGRPVFAHSRSIKVLKCGRHQFLAAMNRQ